MQFTRSFIFYFPLASCDIFLYPYWPYEHSNFFILFSNRCVASYMARMGQCFSTSLDAVGFATSEDTYHDEEDDVETDDRKYCFSDGVGKISEELAAEVW